MQANIIPGTSLPFLIHTVQVLPAIYPLSIAESKISYPRLRKAKIFESDPIILLQRPQRGSRRNVLSPDFQINLLLQLMGKPVLSGLVNYGLFQMARLGILLLAKESCNEVVTLIFWG